MSRADYEALAAYFKDPKTPGPGSADIAKFILLNAQTAKPLGPGLLKDDKKPSLLGRIFDILSRTNYAAASGWKTFAEQVTTEKEFSLPEIYRAQFRGLQGKDKTLYKDALIQAGMEKGTGTSILGLGLDIFADPLTYLPIGGAVSKIRQLTKGKTAEEVALAAEKPYAQTLLNKGEPVFPESFGLPPRPAIPEVLKGKNPTQANPYPIIDLSSSAKPKPSDQLTLPGLEGLGRDKIPVPKIDTPPVGQKLDEIPGQQALNFPDFTVKAERSRADKLNKLAARLQAEAPNIVGKIAAGDITAAAKLVPKVPLPLPKTGKLKQTAEDVIAKFDPNLSSAILNKKYPESLNARQQAKLWHSSYNAARSSTYSKGRKPESIRKAALASALRIYKAAEDSLVSQGKIPRLGTGENVRLSEVLGDLIARGVPITDDIIKEFSTAIKPGSEVWKSVEILRARGAIDESKSVTDIVDKITEAKTVVDSTKSYSDSQTKMLDDFLKKFAGATARKKGLSPAAVKSTEKIIDFTLRTSKSYGQLALESHTKMLDDIIATGKANPKVNGIVTKALEKDLGTLPKWVIEDNKATEFFMGRVATWWGQKELRPLTLNALGSSYATAATRGKALDNVFAPFELAQRHEALKLIQGFGKPTSPEVAELSVQLKKMMDNLVGNVTATSVLTRSAISREMLNKWMREYKVGFEFTASKKVEDFTGVVHDFSKGSDWVNSWKIANISDDPKVFLFKLQQAMEQATKEKALFDELGERFGSVVPGKGYKTKLEGYPYLNGYYFTEDIAKQIPRVVKDWSIPSWRPKSDLVKHYDRLLSMWKAGVTIYRPAHHMRNFMGDVYLGWMDGVNTVRPYLLAARVQKSMKGAYETLADVDRLVEVGALSKSFKTPVPGEILFRNKSGVPFTAEQIAAVAHQKGLIEHSRVIEDIIDLGDQSSGILNKKPFGGKIQAVARGASELHSHNTRLAHFIDKIEKSKGSNLQEIFENASRRARKWHPSGIDLTQFERQYMRRIMPFYTWMRKSLPLLAEGLVMNPGKTVIPAKVLGGIQDVQGIETQGREDPFPVDQMFPQWIRATGVGPIADKDSFLAKLSNQQPEGYVLGGVGLNPFADLIAQMETPGKTLASSISPAAQIPMELLTGRKTFTGEPITGVDARPGALEQYVGENIPVWSAFQGITGITPFGTETKKSAQSGGSASREALVNWLTSAGIKGTGPYIDQARYEQLAPGRMQKKLGREEFLAELRKRSEGGS